MNNCVIIKILKQSINIIKPTVIEHIIYNFVKIIIHFYKQDFIIIFVYRTLHDVI